MNFYDVILAGKLQDMTYPANFFDLLFARKLYPADVWEIYEGTLPATFNANGDDMRTYQVYGNVGGVGDKTVNLFDKNATDTNNGFINNKYIYKLNGAYIESNNYFISEYIPVTSNTTYTWIFSLTTGTVLHSNPTVEFYDSLRQSLGTANHNSNITKFSFTTPQNCDFIRASVYKQTRGESLLVEGTTAPSIYIPYGYEVDMGVSDGTTSTTTPIYIGDTPLEKDEYVDYAEQKVYRRTAQVMPSAPAETKTSNGITVTCDGEGHYSISGTATSNATIRFDIPEFVIPISVDGGGDGTFSMFNDFTSQNVKLYFRYGETVIDVWTPYPVNRTQTVYSLMGNETTNGISITVTSGTTINGTISPMFTDNGILPETYTPYLQPTDPPVALPALPTCGGTTIVDYAGQSVAVPEKGLFEYKGGT